MCKQNIFQCSYKLDSQNKFMLDTRTTAMIEDAAPRGNCMVHNNWGVKVPKEKTDVNPFAASCCEYACTSCSLNLQNERKCWTFSKLSGVNFGFARMFATFSTCSSAGTAVYYRGIALSREI